MRILLITILVLIICSNSLLPQWSTDPNNNLVIATGWDPHIVSDSAGGCYITYNYGSFYPQKLAVERLDKYGYKPWGDKKQILGELPEQWQAQIIEDEEGGVIVSYEDNQVVGTDFTSRVRVQKVDSNGNFLWGQTGVRVTTEETNHGIGGLVSDGDGGCVIVWQNYDERILMNRIDRTGQRVWGDSGILIALTGTYIRIVTASDSKYYVQSSSNIFRINQNGEMLNLYTTTLGEPVPDQEGGIVLSNKVWTGMIPKLVAQRKDSLGNNLWQEPYVEIADSVGPGSFMVGTNQRIINYTWLGTYNGQTGRPYFQSINFEGTIVNPNKILLSADSSGITIIGITSSYNMNTIFSWSITSEINAIYAQMYDTSGNKQWNANGVIVAHPRLTYQKYTTDGRGGFIVAGLINNFTVVVQQVSKNGYLGEIITHTAAGEKKLGEHELILNQNYPNPFNSSSVIEYSVPLDGNILIELFNAIGERVKTLVNKFQTKGVYTINLSSDDLSSGIYLYKLQTETKFVTKKLLIIK